MNNKLVAKPEEPENREIIVNESAEAVSFTTIRDMLGIGLPPVKADTLIDKTFDIIRAKTFKSSYDKGRELVYYCIVKPVDSPEKIAVVIGGVVAGEVLDAICDAQIDQPVRVTLRYKELAHDAGYYYFE